MALELGIPLAEVDLPQCREAALAATLCPIEPAAEESAEKNWNRKKQESITLSPKDFRSFIESGRLGRTFIIR